VTNDVIFIRNAITAMHVTGCARDIQRLATGIAFDSEIISGVA